MVWILQWLDSLTLKDIFSWAVNNVAGEVIAGIILLFVSFIIIKKWMERRDKTRIYNWLYDKTKHLKPFTVGSPELTDTWPTTVEISSAVDLTEERVHYICTIDNRIQRQEISDIWPNQDLEERWAVRKFVRR